MTRSDAMVLKIVVDNKQAKRELKEFSGSMGKTASTVKVAGQKIETANKKAANSTRLLSSAMAKLGAVIGVVAAAAAFQRLSRVAIRGMRAAVEAAGIQETAEIKLAQAIRLTGKASKDVLPALMAQASALQDLTGIGDEVILSNQAMLVSMGKLEGEGLRRATQAAIDMAAANDQLNLASAFDLIAKAAVGYTSTLSRYGIILDESIPKSEKFAAALAKIEEMSGGQAAAQLDTYDGRLRELAGRWGDLNEQVGEAITKSPAIRNLLSGISDAVKDLTGNLENFETEQAIRAVIAQVGTLAKTLNIAGESAIITAKALWLLKNPFPSLKEVGMAAELFDDIAAASARVTKNNALLDQVIATALREPVEIDVKPGTEEWDTWLAALRGKEEGITIPLGVDPSGVQGGLDAGGPYAVKLDFEADVRAKPLVLPGLDKPRAIKELLPAEGEENNFEKLRENYDIFLQAQQDAEIAAVENALSLKLARIITGEEVITQVMMEALANRHLMEGELNAEQLAAMEQARQDSANRIDAIQGGVVASSKKWGEMDVNEKKRSGQKMAAVGAQLATAAFGKSKAIQVAGAISATALGVINMAGFIPANAAPAMMAATAAIGALQVAKIASQKAPGAAHGMMVQGGTPGRDSVLVNTQQGEAIIPPKLTADLRRASAFLPPTGIPSRPDASGLPRDIVRTLSFAATPGAMSTNAIPAYATGGIVGNVPAPVVVNSSAATTESAGGNTFVIFEGGDREPGEWRRQAEDDPDGFMSAMRNAIAVGA